MTPDEHATLLAIDTATPSCSLALLHRGVRRQEMEREERKHTQVILPLTDTLLRDAGITMDAVNGIVISAGPGAFTGLRVGAAVAMGLGCAHDIPLLAISSLALLAATAARRQGDGRVLALLDARMQQVYAGLYQCVDGKISALADDRLCAPQDIPAAWLAEADYCAGLGCVYPFIQQCAKPYYTDILPEAVDAFDLLAQGRWQSAWDGVNLRYLRDEVVQS